MMETIVVAIGGNSLIKDKTHQTLEDQYKNICETVKHIVNLIKEGYRVVITHGNGPQVGFALRRSEIACKVEGIHPVPLVDCVAITQGSIGYQIQQAFYNEFQRHKINNLAVTLITQVLVSKNDRSFQKPTKPIGAFYTKEQAEKLKQENPDWIFIEDAGRGYRRVVASPKPIDIIEKETIKKLIDENFCVICAGGGGVPVIEKKDGIIEGIDAVIDKDFASSLLASEIKADIFLISTAVDRVFLNYNKPNQKELDILTIEQAEKYIKEGHFGKGSMEPKVKACIDFIKNGGKKAIITSMEAINEALEGKNGTIISK